MRANEKRCGGCLWQGFGDLRTRRFFGGGRYAVFQVEDECVGAEAVGFVDHGLTVAGDEEPGLKPLHAGYDRISGK